MPPFTTCQENKTAQRMPFPASQTHPSQQLLQYSQQHRIEKIRSRFELEDAILDKIKQGYVSDSHTAKLISAATGMPNIQERDGFWFVDECLIILNGRNVRETLFHIAHDKLGHFGSPKSYEALQASFYWPNMRHDLESAYIPACAECQQNKSRTTKPVGPLHPLPIPDKRCDSVAINFIGPLPPDEGFNSIVTFTDRLGSDIRIVPMTTNLTAKQLAKLFFKEWYCENGLPLDIVSDRDKLFTSCFWKALHKLTDAIRHTRPGRLERSRNVPISAAHDRGGPSKSTTPFRLHSRPPEFPTPFDCKHDQIPSAAALLRAPILPTPLCFGFGPTSFYFSPIRVFLDPFVPLLFFVCL
jgi:hypothetical protein